MFILRILYTFCTFQISSGAGTCKNNLFAYSLLVTEIHASNYWIIRRKNLLYVCKLLFLTNAWVEKYFDFNPDTAN